MKKRCASLISMLIIRWDRFIYYMVIVVCVCYSYIVSVDVWQLDFLQVLSGNIENVQIKEKAKFPQDFFPEV